MNSQTERGVAHKLTRVSLLTLMILVGLGLVWMVQGPISLFGVEPAQVYATPKINFTPALSHRFDRPIALTHPSSVVRADQASRETSASGSLEGAFIAEQGGVIWRVQGAQVTKLIDLSPRVSTRHNEEGLLGLTHAPSFPIDPRLFIYYSARAPRRSVLAELTLSEKLDEVKEITELLSIPQPYGNHNGGALAFGPDQRLYVALGDGGAGGDPHNHGQDRSTLLGSILRLDVSQRGRAVAPRDNPFINRAGIRPEIWAYGLRNPWRISFDHERGDLWVGDVGQNRYEEVNIVRAGDNLGWRLREGRADYQNNVASDPQALSEKSRDRLVEPVAVYDRSQGISITGGYVYRGANQAQRGQYIYADFATGRVWSLNAERAVRGQAVQPRQVAQVKLNIASFAEDHQRELYALSFDGVIYHLGWR